jgi:serine/tyrosine/threonine adenylyltransferase
MQQPLRQRVADLSAGTDLSTLDFDDSFTRALSADPEARNFVRQVSVANYSHVAPTPVSAPRLLAWSDDCAALLGMSRPTTDTGATVEILAGNRLAPTMRPYASRYGGHQFGVWAGQLGEQGPLHTRAPRMDARSSAHRCVSFSAAKRCISSVFPPLEL